MVLLQHLTINLQTRVNSREKITLHHIPSNKSKRQILKCHKYQLYTSFVFAQSLPNPSLDIKVLNYLFIYIFLFIYFIVQT